MDVGTTNQETGEPDDLTFQASAKAALGDQYESEVAAQPTAQAQYAAAINGMLNRQVLVTFRPVYNNPDNTRIDGRFKPVTAASGGGLSGTPLI